MPAPQLNIRPATLDDVLGIDAVALEALYGPTAGVDEADRARWSQARIGHLVEADPGGAWVAEADGRIAGVALALLREGIWGFSLFAVSDELQGRGVGRRLLERSFAYGDGAARGHIVLSSESPAAMRLYARLGLPLRPAVAAAGIPRLDAMPEAVARVEDAGADGLALADEIGREVRGAGHGLDLPVPLANGATLLSYEDRGFAAIRGGKLVLLAARDDDAAALLLWSFFSRAGAGVTVQVDYLTAGQDWAIRTCIDAGLALSPDGPMFAGGELGPMRPYVPSGAYL